MFLREKFLILQYLKGEIKMKVTYKGSIFLIAAILCFSLVRCENLSVSENQQRDIENVMDTENIIEKDDESEPRIGEFPLSESTKKFLFGKWKVKRIFGFYESWNDESEYPKGQDIIGDELIIQPETFSSMGLRKYKAYQKRLSDPYYYVCESFNDIDSLYRVEKLLIPGLKDGDEIEVINVARNTNEIPEPFGFICIDNKRLLLSMEATLFELDKILE